jgi:nucleoside triphosphate diphosphatase
MSSSRGIARLLEIMAVLRTPETGCAWDLAQTSATIARYTIEEAYEVADAIARNDLDELQDELGDLLLQVVFHSRIAEESGVFTFGDVVEGLADKLVRRHPHVFGTDPVRDSGDVETLWNRIKAEERAQKSNRKRPGQHAGILADVPIALPALTRAYKLQAKAAEVGFDWNDARTVIAKIDEEAREIEAELATGARAAAAAELGDLLFAAVNLARHLDVDPEELVRAANAKFEARFAAIERALSARGKTPQQATLEEMEELWNEAKAAENSSAAPPLDQRP